MDGTFGAAIANEFTVTNMGLLLLVMGTWVANYVHARDCQKRRKHLHEQDNDIIQRVTKIENDVSWIREHLEKLEAKIDRLAG